jgi:acyl carrier protein
LEISESVIQLIMEVSNRKDIALNTTIQAGLGIEGVDAEELLGNIAEKFGTDFSSMDFDEYFCDEFSLSWGLLLLPLTPIAWGLMALTETGKKTDITVQDLVDAVQRGNWQHPNRAAKFPWQRSKVVE